MLFASRPAALASSRTVPGSGGFLSRILFQMYRPPMATMTMMTMMMTVSRIHESLLDGQATPPFYM
jgi:hypothetical protein